MTTAPYTAAEIISLTNAARQTANLAPLHPNQLLTAAAQTKAAAMLQAGSWSHNTPSATAWAFLDQAGYRYQIAGENLARNFTDPKLVLKAWMNSPSHQANLLNPAYTETGVAVATGSGQTSTLVVQYLATPLVQTNIEPEFHPTEMINFSPAISYFVLLIPVLILAVLVGKHFKKNHKPPIRRPLAKHWRS